MQAFVRQFIEIVKRGDVDAVVQEVNRSGIDISSLVDEANYKQTPMFYTSLIPDDSQAV